MTTKVDWGEKLEPHEVERERQLWAEKGKELSDVIVATLEEAGLNIYRIQTANFVCVDCPECPHECHRCLVDANCAEMLRPQAAHVIVTFKEEVNTNEP
jgi:hypothetical protein